MKTQPTPATPGGVRAASPPVIETYHSDGGLSLHFRFIGEDQAGAYIVNVQFPADDPDAGARLKPSEYGRAVAELLHRLAAQAAQSSFTEG